MKRRTTDEFVAQAHRLHNNRYDYGTVVYQDSNTPVEISCLKHGKFIQLPRVHLNHKGGCPSCKADWRRETTSTFLTKAEQVHSTKFDYSRVENIVNQHTKIWIGCRIHGFFSANYQ